MIAIGIDPDMIASGFAVVEDKKNTKSAQRKAA